MKRKIVIVTGLSGSGKSTVARTLEDVGFFCVDNLPVDLLPKLVELADTMGGEILRLALVIDLRQRKFFPRYSIIINSLESAGISLEVLFVDSRDDVLVRRYSETRRQHPLAPSGNLLDGIRREREELKEIRERADWIIDSSDMTVHQLREEIRKIFESFRSDYLKIVIMSFGFGKGLPMESDIVLDVRFLPNPYFVEDLKSKTGRDPEVADWILTHEVTLKYLEKLEDLMVFLLPLYIREGKQYLTISIGCTGGRHRSVLIAEHIARLLIRNDYTRVEVKHRELAD
ncbi:MAG: RNase adapter RapZ [Desulfomonile tiedjei]|uniref:RNase adapter RapZ n=1 Tax=Desulfomonile tiedjei TaxID=2358 RepID=A0A9D6V5V0_9BACT|nr:RNase adapter RapZ [Desulfomonile tiedjei]